MYGGDPKIFSYHEREIKFWLHQVRSIRACGEAHQVRCVLACHCKLDSAILVTDITL